MADRQNPNPAETYESYLVPALFAPWARVLCDRAAPQPGERVLDLACGTGIVSRQVAPLVGSAGRVVGIDINPDMVAVARSLAAPDGPEVEWRTGDATALDVPSESFDLVLCQQGFQFFPDRAAAAREIHRALAGNGRAVVAAWQSLDRHEVMKALFTAEARHLQLPLERMAAPYSLADGAELRALFEEAGFDRVLVETATLDVSFPSVDHWVDLTVRAGAAVMPELAHDGEKLSALLQAVRADSADVISRYRHGDVLTFPTHAHIVVARK